MKTQTETLNNTIHFPTEAETEALKKDFFTRLNAMAAERRTAAQAAVPALDRLCLVMQNRSGQCFKIRNLLYSLWNGKPASLVELVSLDWEIRKDLVAVLLAFGWEDPHGHFFYAAIKAAVVKAGQWDWFTEEGDNVDQLRQYVKSADERERGPR